MAKEFRAKVHDYEKRGRYSLEGLPDYDCEYEDFDVIIKDDLDYDDLDYKVHPDEIADVLEKTDEDLEK